MAIVRKGGMGTLVTNVPCSSASPVGMGCPDCMGRCNGMGAFMDGTGLFGTGLFASGLDPSTWGVGEYAAILVGGYVLFSVFSTTRRGAQAVASYPKRRRSRRAARRRLESL